MLESLMFNIHIFRAIALFTCIVLIFEFACLAGLLTTRVVQCNITFCENNPYSSPTSYATVNCNNITLIWEFDKQCYELDTEITGYYSIIRDIYVKEPIEPIFALFIVCTIIFLMIIIYRLYQLHIIRSSYEPIDDEKVAETDIESDVELKIITKV
jgi:hypothetical protein